MIRWAAEHGFDRIAWTTGQQQADRYGLEQQINQVRYIAHDDGTYDVWASDRYGAMIGDLQRNRVSLASVEAFVAADVAGKIAEGAGHQEDGDMVLEGLDLVMGGEGIKTFYDDILPKAVEELVKKWGGKVTRDVVDLNVKPGSYQRADGTRLTYRPSPNLAEAHFVDVTPEMRETALEGLPMFERSRYRRTVAKNESWATGSLVSTKSDLSQTEMRPELPRISTNLTDYGNFLDYPSMRP